MKIQLVNTRLALRNSTTRLPFRYGRACLTWCPQAILQADLEVDGRQIAGFSGDCLPPSWFDKTAGRSFEQQIEDMLAVIETSCNVFRQAFITPTDFFRNWIDCHHEVHRLAAERKWTGLLASFGVSMVERAMIDGIARAAGCSFSKLVRNNILEMDPTVCSPRLKGLTPKDWLPDKPNESVFVRHTVGLSDPLTAGEILPEDRLDDGQPQSLEEYVVRSGIRYLKIKVCNDLTLDLDRLVAIAGVIETHRRSDYRVTLDGNEQYGCAEDFDGLIDGIKGHSALQQLWENTLLIEQPLSRDIALKSEATHGVRRLSAEKPVIVDESDESLDSYSQAIELGYRGVSSKNCKGPIKSLFNAGLTWSMNQESERGDTDYVMSGEDLGCVGIVPVQSDLCLIATLGLRHVERNGHHYHPGLSYLPADQQEAALKHHPDFYESTHGIVRPAIHDGQFRIGSIQCIGFGFSVLPDVERMISADRWRDGARRSSEP